MRLTYNTSYCTRCQATSSPKRFLSQYFQGTVQANKDAARISEHLRTDLSSKPWKLCTCGIEHPRRFCKNWIERILNIADIKVGNRICFIVMEPGTKSFTSEQMWRPMGKVLPHFLFNQFQTDRKDNSKNVNKHMRFSGSHLIYGKIPVQINSEHIL